MAESHEDQAVQQPFVVSNLLNGQSVASLQAVFPLTEADFLRLKGSQPVTTAFATIIFSGVIGYAISLGPKLEPLASGGKFQLTTGETWTLILGVGISVLLYAIGFMCPNEKKRTMRLIENHFKRSKPSTHIVGGQR